MVQSDVKSEPPKKMGILPVPGPSQRGTIAPSTDSAPMIDSTRELQ